MSSVDLKQAANQYLPVRLQKEIEDIRQFIAENQELNSSYMNIVDTQIPISTHDWLRLDLQAANSVLMQKETINILKTIKKVDPSKDVIFAPFCLLMGLDPTKSVVNGEIKEFYHLSALRFISNINFWMIYNEFNRDMIKEDQILKAFEFLNREELAIENVKRYHAAAADLVQWCQSIVTYHIITHPYKIRNTSTISPNSDLYSYANTVDSMMSCCTAFKVLLSKIGLIPKEMNFAFNLAHCRVVNSNKKISFSSIPLTSRSLIIQFLSVKEALAFSCIGRSLYEGVKEHWPERLAFLLTQIEQFKLRNLFHLNNKFPELFTVGFLSSELKLLDELLNNEKFLTRSQIEEIKASKKFNNSIESLLEAMTLILKLKPKRRSGPDGIIKNDFSGTILGLTLHSELAKEMKKTNIYGIDTKKILQVEELINNLSPTNLKRISNGFFFCYLWIKSIVFLHKILNPIKFINPQYLINRTDNTEYENIMALSEAIESWKCLFAFRLKCNNNISFLPEILNKAKELLADINQEYVNSPVWVEVFPLYHFYLSSKDVN